MKAMEMVKESERVTVENLVKIFSVPEDGARTLVNFIGMVEDEEGIDDAMKMASELIGGRGVAFIDAPGERYDTRHRGAVARYVIVDNTYDPTVLYDTGEREFLITSWGGWYGWWTDS